VTLLLPPVTCWYMTFLFPYADPTGAVTTSMVSQSASSCSANSMA
ncbi:uncharacterized protein METZ01_LOCUS158546, partial [marine metagenome]